MLGRRLVGGPVVIAAVTLVGCASSAEAPGDDVPSRRPPPIGTTTPGSVAGCGVLPSSTGPLAGVAHLAITAPASAPAGRSVSVTVTVRSTAVMQRVITTPGTSSLLVVRGDRVVARSLGRASAPQAPLQLSSGAVWPAQVIPKSVPLAGCASGSARLPTGRYALVAVLGYELDTAGRGTCRRHDARTSRGTQLRDRERPGADQRRLTYVRAGCVDQVAKAEDQSNVLRVRVAGAVRRGSPWSFARLEHGWAWP